MEVVQLLLDHQASVNVPDIFNKVKIIQPTGTGKKKIFSHACLHVTDMGDTRIHLSTWLRRVDIQRWSISY